MRIRRIRAYTGRLLAPKGVRFTPKAPDRVQVEAAEAPAERSC